MCSKREQYSDLELRLFAQDESQYAPCVDLFTAATLEDDSTGFHVILLRNTENINRQNKSGWSPLMYACQSGNLQAVQLLLQYNANERICNSKGQTALMIASAFGYEDILQILNTESEINRIDSRGWTSLMYATSFGHIEAAKYLVLKGADVNSIDPISGQSILMMAAADIKACNVLLPFLIGRGADHTLLSKEMKSAADIARELGQEYEQIADYLQNPFQNQRQEKLPQSLQELLKSIDMDKYISLFEQKKIDLVKFTKFTEQDLKNIGVRLLGPRKRMAGAIEDFVHDEARNRAMLVKHWESGKI